MRAVVQRVLAAAVRVDGRSVGEIGPGFLALIGVARDDTSDDATSLGAKIAGLRICKDGAGAMNLSLTQTGGAVLAVSQFTLFGDVRKGRRPSFVDAAPPETARPLFERVVAALRGEGLRVATGVFGADMEVSLVNDGPVTILLDSKRAL